MRWLFVLGPARSGTSLVGALLSMHPRAVIMHEAAFPLQFHNAANGGPPADIVFRNHHGNRWHRRPVYQWSPSENTPTPRDACFALRRCFGGPEVFGDKDPGACFYWREIIAMLPEARFIITQRGREDIIASHERRSSRDPVFRASYERHGTERIDQTILESETCARVAEALVVENEVLQESSCKVIREMLDWAGLSQCDYPMDAALEFFKHDIHVF
jgi:hypothetical protein